MTTLYEIAEQQSELYSEMNDCTVKALAIAGNMSYSMAHQICKKFGRKKQKGMHIRKHLRAFLKSGYKLTAIHKNESDLEIIPLVHPSDGERIHMRRKLQQKNGSRFTPKSILRICDKNKRYIAYTDTHVLAIVNGEVQDWTEGRKHRIVSLFEVN